MKNVLLPTDLTIQSLRPVHEIVKGANGEPVTVFIVHFISPPTSITDLLFINQSKPSHKVPVNFKEALDLLRNKYEGVISLVFDFVHCYTSRFFNNFIEGHRIEEVYMVANHRYRQPLPQSENPGAFLNKCKVRLQEVALKEEAASSYLNLSLLLNAAEQTKSPERNKLETAVITYS